MSTPLTLPRSMPELQGISSKAITKFVTACETSIESLHSFMLLRHGSVVAEGWWRPWRSEAPHMLFSLSKSFTSTAVGLAVAEGYLTVDDPVISFFPDDTPKKVSKNLADMKVHHLLSMSTGHELDTTEAVMRSRQPIKKFLSLPVEHLPGTFFVYNSGASYMLAAIVHKLTGQTLVDYLWPRLFKPLGIEGAVWDSHPNGVNFGGWGLNIETEDIAKFGQLYLQRGLWNGQRILPESWVEAASSKRVPNGNDPASDWCQGYGYQFWRCRHNAYRGDGAFGQFCIVMPDQDAVLAMTGGVAEMQPVLDVVWQTLLPAMEPQPLPANRIAGQKLASRLSRLEILPPPGERVSPRAVVVSGKTFAFEPNDEKLRSLRFDFDRYVGFLTYDLSGGKARRGKHRLTFGYRTWHEDVSLLSSLTPQCVATSGVWTSEDTFTLTICQFETPFISTITCRFEGGEVFLDQKINVSFMPSERPQLVGKIEQ